MFFFNIPFKYKILISKITFLSGNDDTSFETRISYYKLGNFCIDDGIFNEVFLACEYPELGIVYSSALRTTVHFKTSSNIAPQIFALE
jgi:hypothetical protein